MLDIQALEQLRKERKQARLQALQSQASEDLPKEGHGTTCPPTARSSSAHNFACIPTISVPAAATPVAAIPTVVATPSPSYQPCKRTANPSPLKAQPPSSRRLYLLDEATGEDIELATNAVALDNLVSYHRGLKEEAEARLSQSVDDLNSTSADLSRVLTKFENASTELKATSDKLLEVSEELSAEKLSSEKLNAHLATTEQELALTQGREAQLKGQLVEVSKEAVITEYKAYDDFTMDWMDKVLPYYNQGKFHVMRMAAASGASSFQLFK